MIAHVVFDLPLDGHFDYLIPKEMIPAVSLGARVKVHLGTKPMTGFVIDVVKDAEVAQLKPIRSVVKNQPPFDQRDLAFAQAFAAYYGSSLGESLATIIRHRKQPAILRSNPKPTTTLVHCPDGQYLPVIDELTRSRNDYAVIVPDAAVANGLNLPASKRPWVGLRTSMFEAFARAALLIVIDEDNPSYKQEQSPMYESRQVILMAQKTYGFDLVFISATPSVELMQAVDHKEISYQLRRNQALKPSIVDLNNYKFLEKGILSPSARSGLETVIKAKGRSLIILNRRGTYSVTRCTGCGMVLKCVRCDAAMTYSKIKKQFVCRHCTLEENEGVLCPVCRKLSWKSFGMGIEQLERELAVLFPAVKVASFDKDEATLPERFDILIATQAVMRFKHKLKVDLVMAVDFDAALNRLDMRSSFNAWRLAGHLRMFAPKLLVQTRNIDHHVIKALTKDDQAYFYKEELALRQELGFAPFKHWIAITIRARLEKSAQSFGEDVYNVLSKNALPQVAVMPLEPAVPAKLRDQYRYQVICQTKDVRLTMAFIKSHLGQLKRKANIIVTLNIDP